MFGMFAAATRHRNVEAPITSFAANTANLSGTGDYFDAGTALVYGNFDFFVTARISIASRSYMEIATNQDSAAGDIWRLSVQADRIEFLTSYDTYAPFYTVSVAIPSGAGVYNVVAGLNRSSNHVYISVNGSAITTTADTSTFTNAGYKTLFGAVDLGATGLLTGDLSFCGIGRGVPTSLEITELSSTNAKCYGDLSAGLRAKFADNGAFYELANWSGHTGQEITDQTGNAITLTNVGSIPFTGTGLTVECT
tara:strand:+ start:7273 stop:8028 length:756 start_codon:yes stop_codon:yes gene_type:complete